jgi:hypothetical protein
MLPSYWVPRGICLLISTFFLHEGLIAIFNPKIAPVSSTDSGNHNAGSTAPATSGADSNSGSNAGLPPQTGFVINFAHPVAFEVPYLKWPVYWYGSWMACAFLVSYVFGDIQLQRHRSRVNATILLFCCCASGVMASKVSSVILRCCESE